MKYPISPNGIFWSLQGEGHLRGFQMAFLRLAGCSVGCPGCDTDYSVSERLSIQEIIERLLLIDPHVKRGWDLGQPMFRDRWVWITGGEPADHDLAPLISELRNHDYRIAVATSGAKPVSAPVDWLSVSPHTTGKLAQTFGHELKLVDGLHEILLESSDTAKLYLTDGLDFWFRYVQPLTRGDGSEDPESLARCMAFLRSHSGWALSRQDHRVWGVE